MAPHKSYQKCSKCWWNWNLKQVLHLFHECPVVTTQPTEVSTKSSTTEEEQKEYEVQIKEKNTASLHWFMDHQISPVEGCTAVGCISLRTGIAQKGAFVHQSSKLLCKIVCDEKSFPSPSVCCIGHMGVSPNSGPPKMPGINSLVLDNNNHIWRSLILKRSHLEHSPLVKKATTRSITALRSRYSQIARFCLRPGMQDDEKMECFGGTPNPFNVQDVAEFYPTCGPLCT